MAENFVDRTRVAMARIKNDVSPLDSRVDAATAVKYADAFIKVFRQDLLVDASGNPVDIGTIPNETKGKAYINQLRSFHKDILSASRVAPVAKTATDAEKAAVDTEFPIDLGTEE